jgi:calcium-dependent protein kinase
MGCSNSTVSESGKVDNSKNKTNNGDKIDNNNMNSLTNTLKLKNILNTDELANHYRALEKIGTGTFGKVYKVLHLKTGMERALKVISKSFIKFQDDEKTFLKEIELLSQLDHPNIIKVFEYFCENNNYYVVQELCKGGELYEQIYHIESFTEKSAAQIMKQLLSATYYLHSMNIVHRDLKPENIMLESNDEDEFLIKLIDFGTANYFTEKLLSQKVGTSLYIAPEVICKKYNQLCDIWSCGVILYILLCGFPPFDGDSDEEIMDCVVRDEVSYNEPEWDNISKEAIAFLQKLLNKDYKKRITAENSLKEEWLIKSSEENKGIALINISSQIQNFQKFDSKLKLKNAIMAFMVHHLATEDMTKDLKETFKKMDKSGDGRLNMEELRAGFREITQSHNRSDMIDEEEIMDRFKQIDTDNSNYIEIQEFITVTMNQELLMNEKNLRITFDYFDRDKSGTLDVNEIETLLQIRGNQEDKQMVKDLIAKYDNNNDGVLCFEEFKTLIIQFTPNKKST